MGFCGFLGFKRGFFGFCSEIRFDFWFWGGNFGVLVQGLIQLRITNYEL